MSKENQFLVLGANQYDFTDDKTKRQIKGAKVKYIPNHQGTPQEGRFGTQLLEINTDFENALFFKEGTGIYDLGFQIIPGAKGSPKMILTNARFIKKVNLSDLVTT